MNVMTLVGWSLYGISTLCFVIFAALSETPHVAFLVFGLFAGFAAVIVGINKGWPI
ncbi:MAG TPA: hypothetical protein VH024_17360 [Candidatus Angelobacter sp.]|jgi:hypothetical protein|nr:hypothetical protein [Candidatus Angelobacter sp.]